MSEGLLRVGSMPDRMFKKRRHISGCERIWRCDFPSDIALLKPHRFGELSRRVVKSYREDIWTPRKLYPTEAGKIKIFLRGLRLCLVYGIEMRWLHNAWSFFALLYAIFRIIPPFQHSNCGAKLSSLALYKSSRDKIPSHPPYLVPISYLKPKILYLILLYPEANSYQLIARSVQSGANKNRDTYWYGLWFCQRFCFGYFSDIKALWKYKRQANVTQGSGR